ncbi:MAG: hypothetical protein EOO88_30600 [Pedobacter sp.]|nr:MAG: hypothetical protein EOO88_30600 [Pedobacter sp.]
MNLKNVLCVVAISTIFTVSCKKESAFSEPLIDEKENQQEQNDLPETAALDEPSARPIELTNGIYTCSYTWPITFGSSFPHPTNDPNGFYDGTPLSIPYVAPQSTNTGLSVIDGSRFTIIRPVNVLTGTGGPSAAYLTSLTNYNKALQTIIQSNEPQSVKLTQMANLQRPALQLSAGSTGTWETISGMVVQDHTSPTLMAVVKEKYIVPSAVSYYLLGTSFRTGGYTFSYYIPSGSPTGAVTKVIAKKNGLTVTGVTFNLTWSGNEINGNLVVGTVTVPGQPVFTINDLLDNFL